MSIDAPCFGCVDHLRALKYTTLIMQVKNAGSYFKSATSHKLYELLKILCSTGKQIYISRTDFLIVTSFPLLLTYYQQHTQTRASAHAHAHTYIHIYIYIHTHTHIHEIRKRKANWIGHNLQRNCLLKQVTEGKIKGEIKVTRGGGRRRKKVLDGLKGRTGYSHLKEEALDRTMWRNCFGRGVRPVVRYY
jgi:hypothetical protein